MCCIERALPVVAVVYVLAPETVLDQRCYDRCWEKVLFQ